LQLDPANHDVVHATLQFLASALIACNDDSVPHFDNRLASATLAAHRRGTGSARAPDMLRIASETGTE
jgi:hypothetical protein